MTRLFTALVLSLLLTACGESGLSQLSSTGPSALSSSDLSSGGISSTLAVPRPGYSCSDTMVTDVKVSANSSNGVVVSWGEMGIDGAGYYELDIQHYDVSNAYVSVLKVPYRTHRTKQDVVLRGVTGRMRALVRLVTCNATHIGPYAEALFSLDGPADVAPDPIAPVIAEVPSCLDAEGHYMPPCYTWGRENVMWGD